MKQKKSTLDILQSKSNSVIGFIIDAVENLKNINNEIDAEDKRVSDQMNKLAETKNELAGTKGQNEKMIHNLESLLS
jgi:hypothetical protein